MIHRGARYKVYEPTNTSQLLTCHRWLTRAACRFVLSAEDEEAHLVARADRAAGRRESRYRYGIDHGSALLQRQRAQQQPGQGPGWPSARFANDCISSSIGRMYLSRSNASRDLLRTKTGARRRHVREHPSNRHGRATSETAAAGTCAKDARRQIVPQKAMSVRPHRWCTWR